MTAGERVRPPDIGRPEVDRPEVGLCSACAFAVSQTSARGSRFWRCRRADEDTAFRRYPPLPVERCPGFARGEPGAGGATMRQP